MRNLLFPLFMFFFLLAGCNAFYVPSSTHIPVLRGKNDFHQDVSIGASRLNDAISFSPINHFYLGGTIQGIYNHMGGRETHLSGGPHFGCYANPFSGAMHLNLQGGLGWGNSQISQLHVSGSAKYSSFYFQGFIGGKVGQNENSFIGCGAQYNYVKLKYSCLRIDYNGPNGMPTQEGFFYPFIYFQKGFSNMPNFDMSLLIGCQFEEPRLNSNYGGYGFTLYEPLTFRVGFNYQIQFQKKNELPLGK